MTQLTYAPLETITQSESTAEPSADRVQCGKCGRIHNGGRVKQSNVLEGNVVKRELLCAPCGHLMQWEQPVDCDGQLVTTFHSKPGYVKDRKVIERFVKMFPECRDVEEAC